LGYEEQGRVNSSICGGVAGAEFFRACLDAMDRHYSRSKRPLLSPELCTDVANTQVFSDLTLYPPHVFYPYNPYDRTRHIEQLIVLRYQDRYACHSPLGQELELLVAGTRPETGSKTLKAQTTLKYFASISFAGILGLQQEPFRPALAEGARSVAHDRTWPNAPVEVLRKEIRESELKEVGSLVSSL
jgi:hypothetical protein